MTVTAIGIKTPDIITQVVSSSADTWLAIGVILFWIRQLDKWYKKRVVEAKAEYKKV